MLTDSKLPLLATSFNRYHRTLKVPEIQCDTVTKSAFHISTSASTMATLHTPSSMNEAKSALETTTADPGLFGTELISPEIAASLPSSYTIRSLRKSDYGIGFLDVLRVLTTVGDVTEEEWNERYDWMNGQGKGGYYLLVIEDQGRIVGTGTLLVERKLYASWQLFQEHS